MSHASVLVVTAPGKCPTEDDLNEILLPWHEFECTGIDRCIVDLDETESLREQFENRDAADKAQTFAQFIEDWAGHKPVPFGEKPDLTEAEAHKYGYVELDANGEAVRAIRRTNPRKKWDWIQIGGRFGGLLMTNHDPETDPANQETCKLCGGTGRRIDMVALAAFEENLDITKVCNGCAGKGTCAKWPSHWVQRGNQARWGNLDTSALLRDQQERKGKSWDKAEAVFKEKAGGRAIFGDTLQRYKGIIDDMLADMEAGRGTGALYTRIENNPTANALRHLVGHANFEYGISEAYSREAHMATAEPLPLFAIVKDGEWHDRGQLGWWGSVSNEKDDWPECLGALLSGIKPDEWVTVVDYHI